MEKVRHMAFCGLYCGACSSMIACEKEMEEPTAENVVISEDELPCQGCDSEYQRNCEFVVCNKRHETNSCAFCPEYPCEMITKFQNEEWEHHQVVLTNLNRIKEIGEENWLNEQKEYWKCPVCGSRTIWYQKQCTNCQAEIKNSI